MSIVDWFWVFANFFMPAWVLAVLLAVFAPRLIRSGRRPAFFLNVMLSAILGSLVLLAGLLLTQHDGRMLTYGALILVQASLQWVLQRPVA